MGPVIAAGGTRNLINGDPQNPQGDPQFAQWDPNLPKGTLICQKGPVFPRWDPILADGTHVHGTGIPPPFRCDLNGVPITGGIAFAVVG